MNLQDVALIVAGIIGSGVAVVHGYLVDKMMVRPLVPSLRADAPISSIAVRLVPSLLQFSTFNWFLGGLVLIAAALWLAGEARMVAGLIVGSSYLYGAILNLWGTRGRHPGWALYAAALGLIAFGLCGSGG